MVKLKKLLKIIGICSLATFTYLNSPYINRNYPLIEQSISKSRKLPDQVKNHRPKKLLYLVSEDFKFDYKSINENLKTKLDYMKKRHSKYGKRVPCKEEGWYTYDKNIPSKEKIENLERIIADFNLDKKDFMAHLGDMNLFTNDKKPYIVRENSKDCEVILRSFKNQSEFFDVLLDENIDNLDGIIIGGHGHKGFLFTDVPVEFSDITNLFEPRNHITVRDILNLSPKKLSTIRSKFNMGSVGYLGCCEVLKDDDKRTTIAEALTYLFRMPIVASMTVAEGWPIDVNPYDHTKVDLTKPETITSENMSYEVNYWNGDWFVVYPDSK